MMMQQIYVNGRLTRNDVEKVHNLTNKKFCKQRTKCSFEKKKYFVD